ncbi:MAG: multi-TM2 protein [Neobacillus sp.]|nr:multi-TM2 protein [Neobacillus sp.]
MKSSTKALTLSLFPGLGHIYFGNMVRGVLYLLSVFGCALFTILFLASGVGEETIIPFMIGIFIYLISFIDMGVQISKQKKALIASNPAVPQIQATQDSERFYTIVLSFVPGLGHFQLGLMNRGLTLLAAFLGLGVMVIFITALSSRSEFLVFLAGLPIIWVYGFFDSVQQLNKKQRGEELVDRTIFEDFETRREDGKKSKSIATFLSIFPGAGHLYLGLQKRGIQLMAAFLFSIYILDILRLGIFLFLIPIIWFYSFFDAMQKVSKYGEEEIEDVPIISYLINHQKWVGIGLVVLGVYYLFMNVVIPVFAPMLSNIIQIDLMYWVQSYFQTGIVCVLLIGGGIKLLSGSKHKREEKRS